MTDEPDLRQLSGFRTPLAAAMLSGVLAGAAQTISLYIILWHRISYNGLGMLFFYSGLFIFHFAFLCSGPAIARRSWKLAGWAWLLAFGFSALYFTWYSAPMLLRRAGLNFPGSLTLIMLTPWGQAAYEALSGALLGFALTRLYGFRPYSKWAPPLGASGAIALCLVSNLVIALGGGWYGGDPKTSIPAQTMLTLAGSVFMAVLPTAAIEYSLRQQTRKKGIGH